MRRLGVAGGALRVGDVADITDDTAPTTLVAC